MSISVRIVGKIYIGYTLLPMGKIFPRNSLPPAHIVPGARCCLEFAIPQPSTLTPMLIPWVADNIIHDIYPSFLTADNQARARVRQEAKTIKAQEKPEVVVSCRLHRLRREDLQ